MSKIHLGLTAAALAALAVFAGHSPRVVVHAQSNAALVSHTCPNDFGDASIGGYEFSYCFDDVLTSSGNENGSFHGSLIDPTTAPRKAVHITGFECGLVSGVTTDTEITITPGGIIGGICRIRP